LKHILNLRILFIIGKDGIGGITSKWIDQIMIHDDMVAKIEFLMDIVQQKQKELVDFLCFVNYDLFIVVLFRLKRHMKCYEVGWGILNENPQFYREFLDLQSFEFYYLIDLIDRSLSCIKLSREDAGDQ